MFASSGARAPRASAPGASRPAAASSRSRVVSRSPASRSRPSLVAARLGTDALPSRLRRSSPRASRATLLRASSRDDLPDAPPASAEAAHAAAVADPADAPAAAAVDDESVEVETVPPTQFLLTSVAFYAIMGAGSQAASSFAGVHPDVFDAMRTVNLDQASLWTLPLLASLAFAITQADEYAFLGEVRDIFKRGVLPSLAPLGLPGVLALSLGAGVGEEAFFRGFLMPFADGRLVSLGVPESVASVGTLAATSVFFGALHAITPAYFYWATGAGLLFGLEYVREGLGTAAVTHTLYDFLAFGFILVCWPIEGYERERPFEKKER